VRHFQKTTAPDVRRWLRYRVYWSRHKGSSTAMITWDSDEHVAAGRCRVVYCGHARNRVGTTTAFTGTTREFLVE